jgi:hypothetical protein
MLSLRDPSVLFDAICEGVGMLTWESDTFAFADSYDSVAERYVGLRGGRPMPYTMQIRRVCRLNLMWLKLS